MASVVGHLKTEFNDRVSEHTGENITSLVIILITSLQNETEKLIESINFKHEHDRHYVLSNRSHWVLDY